MNLYVITRTYAQLRIKHEFKKKFSPIYANLRVSTTFYENSRDNIYINIFFFNIRRIAQLREITPLSNNYA